MTRLFRVGVMMTALAAVTAACGGGSTSSAPAGPPPPTVSPVDPATAGNVTGRIAFEGAAPKPAVIRMDSDPNCLQPGVTTTEEQVVVGDGGGLQHVFVYVKDGLGDLRFPVPATPIVLDQKGCRYVPHVFGAQVGQSVEVLNSDPTLHNVHAVPKANAEFNFGQAVKGMKTTRVFDKSEVMVPFRCDVHGWMAAYGGIVAHPFFAVSGTDGSFEIKGLPAGTYTIEAWHERLGTQTQKITVDGKAGGTVGFVFKS